jgi:hypothetical protein
MSLQKFVETLRPKPFFRYVQIGSVVVGSVIILRALWIIGWVYRAIPGVILRSAREVLGWAFPVLRELIILSFQYLWQPLLVYALIALLVRAPAWQLFWRIVGLAGFFLVFVWHFEHFPWPRLEGFNWAALKDFTQSFQELHWQNFQTLPLILLQTYLFALWVLPREVWNLLGLMLSMLLGIIVVILPDLPTAFDDFGIFSAILAFFLGYVNALASLLQRAATAYAESRRKAARGQAADHIRQ